MSIRAHLSEFIATFFEPKALSCSALTIAFVPSATDRDAS